MSKSATILCIDDEPKGLMVRKMLIESQGFEVLTATSGREAPRLLLSPRLLTVGSIAGGRRVLFRPAVRN